MKKRGRPPKRQDPDDCKSVEAIRIALLTNNKDRLYEEMKSLQERDGGLDRILAPGFHARKLSKDHIQAYNDIEIIQHFYKTKAHRFGFIDYADYKLKSDLAQDPPNLGPHIEYPDEIEYPNDLDPAAELIINAKIDDAINSAIEALMDRRLEIIVEGGPQLHEDITEYEKYLVLAIPLKEDIGDIVNSLGLTQQSGEGKSLGERLKKRLKANTAVDINESPEHPFPEKTKSI